MTEPIIAPTLTYRPTGPGLHVNLDALVRTRMLLQASSGGGKSRALRQLLEETNGRVQQLVIDTEGEFATLRERFDYVLAAPSGGDVVATPKTAKLLARRLLELGASAVIDLYDLPVQQRREFVKLFLDELMALPRSLWRPLLVVIDEIQVFAPERGAGEAQSTDAVITLATQGRKRGFCLVGATLRISKLHKDVAAELLNKMVGRTGLDVDVKRAGDELGFDKEERQSLKALAPGEFYVYGPAIAAAVVRARTGDVVTTHPEAGKVSAIATPTPAKVKAMLAELKDLPQEAEHEAKSMDELRAANAKLTADLRRAQRATPAPVALDPDVINRAVTAAVEKARATWTRDLRQATRRETDSLGKAIQQLQAATAGVVSRTESVAAAFTQVTAVLNVPPAEAPPQFTVVSVSPPRFSARPVASSSAPAARMEDMRTERADVSGVEQRILDTIGGFAALGVTQPDADVVAAMVGYHPRAKSYLNAKGALRSRGLIEYPSAGTLTLTPAGAAIAGNALPVHSIDELHALWFKKLGGVAERILRPLIDAFPSECHSDAIASDVGYHPRAKSYLNTKGRLRSLGLIDYPSSGTMRATSILFPEGLR